MIASEAKIADLLATMAPVAVAVSGGVDSLTLATLAGSRLGRGGALMVHATSPAVPFAATARVRDQAHAQGWELRVIDAGEFSDARYRANPVNRCFFCKTNLYAAVAAVTDHQILSGTNTDDLGEYRPGLDAAREHGVRHPFVEAGIGKQGVRDLARALGLPSVAELPAAPCLSSRVETGIPIDPEVLRFIDATERLVGSHLPQGGAGRAVRCRVRASGVVIELDAQSLDRLGDFSKDALAASIAAEAPQAVRQRTVRFAAYRTGSAFLTPVNG